MSAPLPEACGIAFKEWRGVCSALADGRQSVILRKGGIEEGPNGFEPEYPFFWLFPTIVHQAEQGLKPGNTAARLFVTPGKVDIASFAAVEWVEQIDQLETLMSLDPFHVWTEETLTKRFFYKKPEVWLLGVRIFNLPEPVAVPISSEQFGCKTWVPLALALSTAELKPAIPDLDFRETMSRVRDKLSSPGRLEMS